MELLIVLITAIALLFYYFKNKEKVIEKFYYKNNKNLLMILELCFSILIISLFYNLQYLVKQYLKIRKLYISK